MKHLKLYEEWGIFNKKIESPEISNKKYDQKDDMSSNFPYLLNKAYENDDLDIEKLYGNIKNRIFKGVLFSMPYSNGKKRKIEIYISDGSVTVIDYPMNSFKATTDDVDFYQTLIDKYINLLIDTEHNKTNI